MNSSVIVFHPYSVFNEQRAVFTAMIATTVLYLLQLGLALPDTASTPSPHLNDNIPTIIFDTNENKGYL